MTIYSTGSGLFLQSVTENKFKSGLLNATAEWVRPMGSAAIPGKIPTSIGDLDIFPDPTISKDTSGFERITATAYGLWSSNAQETKLNLNTDRVRTLFKQTSAGTASIVYVGLIFETAACKITRNVGDTNVPLMPVMNIYNYNGTPVTQITLADVGGAPYNPGSNFYWPQSATIVKRHYVSNISLYSYGSIEEVEFIFEIVAEATFVAT